MLKNPRFRRFAILAVVAALILIVPAVTFASEQINSFDDTKGYFSQARIYGRTYGRWSAKWWQWVFDLPDENHPLVTNGDVDCSLGQRGKVWYLAGTTGGSAERSCTIKPRRALLFPLINFVWVNTADDCSGPDGCPPVQEKREVLEWILTNSTCTLYSKIDGVPTIYKVDQVRTQSPAFPVTVNNSVFQPGIPPGTVDEEAVADGYWVLVPPLSRGEHTLEFGGDCTYPDGNTFSVDVTYDLDVTR
jgi:hypothetical protein